MGLRVTATLDPATPSNRTVLDLSPGVELMPFHFSGAFQVRLGPTPDGDVKEGMTRIVLDGDIAPPAANSSGST